MDEQFGLLHLNAQTKLTVKSKYFAPSPSFPGGSIQEFIVDKEEIKTKYIDYNLDTSLQKEYTNQFEQYPFLIKIRNNNFKLLTAPNDSSITDEQGRILEDYSMQAGDKNKTLYSRIHYINDSTIIETAFSYLNSTSTVYLYELDNNKNLKSIKEATISTQQAIENSITPADLKFRRTTKFIYDKSKSKIIKIDILAYKKTKWVAETTQFFLYKNGLPSSSHVKDHKINKTTYRQVYTYEKR